MTLFVASARRQTYVLGRQTYVLGRIGWISAGHQIEPGDVFIVINIEDVNIDWILALTRFGTVYMWLFDGDTRVE